MLERITWFVDDRGGTVNCVFEHRRNLSYPELRSYIQSQIVAQENEIHPEIIRNIEAEEGWQYKNLQVADCCVGSLFNALELNEFGHVEQGYIFKLQDKLYRRKGKLFQYGLKLFPHSYQALRSMVGLQWVDEINT